MTMNHPERRRLLKDRIRLLKAIESWKDGTTADGIPVGQAIAALIRKDAEGNFLSMSQEQTHKVSYARSPMAKFEDHRRVRTTLGRYLRRALEVGDGMASDDELARLCAYVCAQLWGSTGSVEVLRGPDVVEAYVNAVGDESCMTGEDARDICQIYAINPDKVGLAVLNKSEGRALLWNCDDGVTLLDRVYPDSQIIRETFWAWCTKSGYSYRTGTGGPSYGRRDNNNKNHSVTLKCPSNDMYPYMDTLHYGSFFYSNQYRCEMLRLSSDSSDGVAFDFTDGERPCSEEDRISCENCGTDVDADDVIQEGDCNYCPRCHGRLFACCERCDETCLNDDMREVITGEDETEVWCEHCRGRYASVCDDCSNVANDLTAGDGGDYCPNCIVEHPVVEEAEA